VNTTDEYPGLAGFPGCACRLFDSNIIYKSIG